MFADNGFAIDVELAAADLDRVTGQGNRALDERNAWAVGDFTNNLPDAADTLALHWDGSQWRHVPTPGQSAFGASGFLFEAVRAVRPGDIWFGGQANGCVRGEAYVVHMDGSGGFTEHCVRVGQNGAARVRDIDAIAPDDVWAVGAWGGLAVAVGAPFAMHWDGSSWAVNSPPESGFNEILSAVAVVAHDDVWTSGSYRRSSDGASQPLFWHWDGSTWTRFDAPAYAVDLKALASDDIYGVSGDSIVHFDGLQWSLLPPRFVAPSPTSVNLVSIDVLGECDFLLAGHTLSPWQQALARLRAACPADLNDDGDADVFDLLAYVDLWFALDAAADIDGTPGVNVFDLLDYLNGWFTGC